MLLEEERLSAEENCPLLAVLASLSPRSPP
jgi:hypothetical protein